MPGGKCRFQDIWLEDVSRTLWLRKGNDLFTAFCALCKKPIDVTHSGLNALKSHESGKKHKSMEENLKKGKQTTLYSFKVTKPHLASSQVDRPPSPSKSADLTPRPTIINDQFELEADGSRPSTSDESCEVGLPLSTVVPSRISSYLVSDAITKAEILWACNCVSSHSSTRSGGIAVDLFPIMFPDSHIASKMKLQKDKIAYSVTYGLGPYFSNVIYANALKSPFYALSIDESLNEVSQKQQMDVVINYWDSLKHCVSTRYLNSAFLEKCTATDLLESITDCINQANLSLDKLIQLATDGPNVNLKLLFDINAHMKNSLASEKQVLNVGTCSLHIINGAYKTAHAKVSWKIHEFLRAVYQLFKNFPSRRAVYSQITGSKIFPKKFCSVRWTENSSVIKRVLEMMPNLHKYVKEVSKATGQPDSNNFAIVKQALDDPTLESKLHFSCMVAEELEEFLILFQKNSPLLPFLHEEVFKIMKSLASRIVKKNVMEKIDSGTKLKNLDMDKEENLKHFDKIDVGFGAKSCLKKVKEIDLQLFKSDCKKFLLAIYKKLAEKSPLKRRFVLGASCINPSIMTNEYLRELRAKVAIEEFVATNQISPADGDKTLREYVSFCSNDLIKEKAEKFKWKKDRLDLFFSNVFQKVEDVGKHVAYFIKMILVCFHGNAAVERSFSFNKNFLVENLTEKSLVAQRRLHDHINNLSGKQSKIVECSN